MAGNEGVVEPVVIEDRDPHAERRDEPVDRREPVLTFTEVREDLEAPRRRLQSDHEHPLSVAIDEIERAAAVADVPVLELLRIRASGGAHRSARRLEQHLERLAGTLAVEDVARAQGE